MDLKVTNLAQIQQQNALSNLPETDGSFRFALLSNLQENELQSQLAFMMEEITQQGNRISKRMDVRDMKQYRKLIKEFINEISTHSHKFSRENFLDRKGRHRVYGIIKQINQTLDELAEELLEEEKDHLAILQKVDEIRGLIFLPDANKENRYIHFFIL